MSMVRNGAVLAAVVFAVLTGSVLAQTRSVAEELHVFMVVWRGETEVENGFRAYMRERGIPVRYTLRDIARDRSRIPGILADIREAKPDIVHTWGTTTTLEIFGPLSGAEPGRYIEGIPGVFSLVAYPVAADIVESFEHTGRPVTGTAFLPPVSTQVEVIRAFRPFDRLAVIYNSQESNAKLNVEDLERAAAAQDFELIKYAVPLDTEGKPDPSSLPGLVGRVADEGAEFVYMGADSFIGVNGLQVSRAAAERGLPTFANTENAFARSDAMLGVISPYYLIGKLAGAQAARILVDGEKPEDVPVASLARHAVRIRMRMAHELQIYPPVNLLRIAQIENGAQ